MHASSNCASALRTGRPSINEPPPFSDCQSSVYTNNTKIMSTEKHSKKEKRRTDIEHPAPIQLPPSHITTLYKSRHSRPKHERDQFHRPCGITSRKRNKRYAFGIDLVIVIDVEECVDGLCECRSCVPFHLCHISIYGMMDSVAQGFRRNENAPRMRMSGREYNTVRMGVMEPEVGKEVVGTLRRGLGRCPSGVHLSAAASSVASTHNGR